MTTILYVLLIGSALHSMHPTLATCRQTMEALSRPPPIIEAPMRCVSATQGYET